MSPRACRLIEDSEETLSLSGLASTIGLSQSHLHRLFKSVTGLTPKAYATAHRGAKLREGLVSSDSVTEAIYDAGYGFSSRFYEKSTGLLGMTPTQYRAGGSMRRSVSRLARARWSRSSSRPARRALSRSCLVMIRAPRTRSSGSLPQSKVDRS